MKKQKLGFLRNLDRRQTLYIVCGVLAVIVLAFSAGSVYARYAHQESGSSAVTAKNFYFSSNYLTVEGADYFLNAGPDQKAYVDLKIQNFEDALRISDHKIAYTISVTNGGVLTDSLGNVVTGGELESASVPVQDTDEITLSELLPGQSYTVTVSTVPVDGKGFGKTLTAEFTVLPLADRVFMNLNTDDPNVVVLTVWTENIKGNAVINVPAGLIPDGTDAVLNNPANYAGGVLNYIGGMYKECVITDAATFGAPYSSRVYRFFVDGAYNLSEFTVKVNGQTAAKKATIGSIG